MATQKKFIVLAAVAVFAVVLIIVASRGWFGTYAVAGYPDDPYAIMRPQGISALGLAIQEGDREQIERYLAQGANLATLLPDASGGGAPAMYFGLIAVMQKNANTDFFDYLITYGADVNGVSTSRISALHMAAGFGNIESAEKLIFIGADVNARDVRGNTPLMRATEARDAARQQYEETGKPGFHEAERKAAAIIELLRRHGAVE